MNGCIPAAEPRIAILMAIYEPRMDWLRQQLESLEAQTYPNLKLYIRDDCSEKVAFEDIEACVGESIRSFEWQLSRNEKNLGSNASFEALTLEAEGDYFAYCDQDDVWLPEKLSEYAHCMADTGAELVCSDMYVIDAEGVKKADSITAVRRHHIFKSGAGLAPQLLVSNFVTGCAMMIKADVARAAAPFCPDMVHDHYLALCAALKGTIAFLDKPLISYRIHDNNQTGMMAGVYDKATYLEQRIKKLVCRLEWLHTRFEKTELSGEIARALSWAKAREAAFGGDAKAKKTVWKYRQYSLLPSLYEICFSWLPDRLFMIVIDLKKKNIV